MEQKHRLPGACSAGCSAVAWETADGRHLFGRNFDYNRVELETQVHQGRDYGLSRNEITILIAKLTAILRLANSMDRSHRGKLADCRMAVREDELVITTGYKGDLALERASFEQKADFFFFFFGIRPILKQKRSV